MWSLQLRMGFNLVITLLNCAIEHDQHTEYIPHSQHQLGWFLSPCHIIPFYLLNWPISYNSIKLCNIISYVIEGYP